MGFICATIPTPRGRRQARCVIMHPRDALFFQYRAAPPEAAGFSPTRSWARDTGLRLGALVYQALLTPPGYYEALTSLAMKSLTGVAASAD
jgi:hypothetical protein